MVKLTADGRRAWQLFTEQHAEERNADDFPPHLAGPWSKLRGYAARLAAIVHFLRWACGETECEDVDGESMARAAKLVAYFKSHTRKVYAVMDADPRLALARRLLRHVSHEGLKQFTRREAYRAMRGPCKTVDDIDPILALLEAHGFIRHAPAPADNRPGRKASLVYEIHPSTLGHNGHNGHNAAGRGPTNAPAGSSVHSVHSVQGSEEETSTKEDDVGDDDAPPTPSDETPAPPNDVPRYPTENEVSWVVGKHIDPHPPGVNGTRDAAEGFVGRLRGFVGRTRSDSLTPTTGRTSRPLPVGQ